MSYGRHVQPKVTEVVNEEICQYGCETIAKYKFGNGKLCCSYHYNSCSGKRKNFSELDHTARTSKSLVTRTKLGITKSSQIKAAKTRKANGTYDKIAESIRKKWVEAPWNNNVQCPFANYHNSSLVFQGSYEYDFLEDLVAKHSLEWVISNVARGPAINYFDPTKQVDRLYLSDFIIGNTIYEIKSNWTWNKHGTDSDLENTNKAKLTAAQANGYNVVLILEKREYKYD